jgi:hypothetical protein
MATCAGPTALKATMASKVLAFRRAKRIWERKAEDDIEVFTVEDDMEKQREDFLSPERFNQTLLKQRASDK